MTIPLRPLKLNAVPNSNNQIPQTPPIPNIPQL